MEVLNHLRKKIDIFRRDIETKIRKYFSHLIKDFKNTAGIREKYAQKYL